MQSQCPLPGNASLCLVAQTTFAPPVQIDVCRNMFCTWSWQVKIPPQSMKMFSWENPHSKSSDIFQRFSMFDYQRMRDLEPSIHCHSQLKLFYNPGKINNEELNLQILQARSFSSGLAINLPISLVLQFMGHPGFARCDSSTRWALQKLWYIDHLISINHTGFTN